MVKNFIAIITGYAIFVLTSLLLFNLSKHNDQKFNQIKSMTQANDSLFPLGAHCRRLD